MDTQNKEKQQDNMIDGALENFISDKELQVSEKRTVTTNTLPSESCESENSEKKAISIRQFIKEYLHEHKGEAIGLIFAGFAWEINALHNKNKQKSENWVFAVGHCPFVHPDGIFVLFPGSGKPCGDQ